MNEFTGIADTMLIPMAARIYVSKHFPEYFYDAAALNLESRLPPSSLERIAQASSEYTMLASVARYYNFDAMIKKFLAQHKNGIIVNLGAGLETSAFRLEVPGTVFYEIDLPEVITLRKQMLGAKENEVLIEADMFALEWAKQIPADCTPLFIVSGVFQYFKQQEIRTFIAALKKIFPHGELIFDATNETGIKYANKYVRKTGNTSAQMYFYVNDSLAFARSCDTELLEQRTFYTDARKLLKRKLKLYTRIAMKVCDDGGRTIILHLKLNK